VRATISRRKLAVALSLTEADGHGIKLYATSDAPCDAFIRLVQHTVRA
jgi:hypothetical protein